MEEKLSLVSDHIQDIGRPDTVEHLVNCALPDLAEIRGQVRDNHAIYTVTDDELRF